MTLLFRAAAIAACALLPGCATTPGCRWRVVLEPRATATVDQHGEVKPTGSVTARPICEPRPQPAGNAS